MNIALRESSRPRDAQQAAGFAAGVCFSKLFWVFMIGSFAGFILETVWCLLVHAQPELHVGVLYGPLIPIYGAGCVLLTVFLYRLRRNGAIFLAGGLIGGAFEYLCSLFQEIFFGTTSWDYSNSPLNFGGRTNIWFMLLWGALGLVWIRVLYPRLSAAIERMPRATGRMLTCLLCAFMAYNLFITATAVARQSDRRAGYAPSSAFERYLDTHYTDAYLNRFFPTAKAV